MGNKDIATKVYKVVVDDLVNYWSEFIESAIKLYISSGGKFITYDDLLTSARLALREVAVSVKERIARFLS